MIDTVASSEQLYKNISILLDKRFPKSGNICKSIGLYLDSVDYETKTAVFSHTTKEDETNFRGTMHGGLVSWLMDTSMGILACAYARTNNPTLNLNVNFIRAIVPGNKLLVKTSINSVGSHIITTECKIFITDNGNEVLAASGNGSFYRFELDHTLLEENND